jgi:tryptophanyl-tRNA synthetase
LRVLSGIQPSGRLHIGNYFGMMRPMIGWQERSELFCFIVNLHALTSVTDGKALASNTLEAAADFLALGLDPDRCYLWVQADVPEVCELTWILHNHTSMGLLERAHSYKDKASKQESPHHGLFSYPVLMAADILLYQADVVPVGKDQKQHLEMTRDIAGAFNRVYGKVFTLPEPAIDPDVAVVPGIDGQKMSKSYNNAIEIFITKEQLKKRVMAIKTDGKGIDDVKDPDSCILFAITRVFMTPDEQGELRARYLAPGLQYGEAKKELVERIWDYFGPFRERREALLARRDDIRDILAMGARKVRPVAAATMEIVRERVGLKY